MLNHDGRLNKILYTKNKSLHIISYCITKLLYMSTDSMSSTYSLLLVQYLAINMNDNIDMLPLITKPLVTTGMLIYILYR